MRRIILCRVRLLIWRDLKEVTRDTDSWERTDQDT